jgi:hypothetical protein
MGGRAVWRVRGDRVTVVVKEDATPRELAFYAEVAPRLSGVPVPLLLWGGTVDDTAWLVLEDVPHPLPRERWASPEVYTVLVSLHFSVAAYAALADPFPFPGLPAVLTGSTPVSGDPNPRNWAVRGDGALVLLDWERAGFATPAVDVAITLPGLPSPEDAVAATTAYRRAGGDSVDPEHVLLAKHWTARELLAENRDDDGLRATQAWLTDALPRWLETWP